MTLPPPLETQRFSAFGSPRVNPHEVLCGETEKLEDEKFPTHSIFSCWQLNFQKRKLLWFLSFLWIREIESAQTIDDLKTSPSIAGNQYSDFEMLDVKIATALKKISTNTNFKKKVFLEEQKAQKSQPISSRTTNSLHDPRILSHNKWPTKTEREGRGRREERRVFVEVVLEGGY